MNTVTLKKSIEAINSKFVAFLQRISENTAWNRSVGHIIVAETLCSHRDPLSSVKNFQIAFIKNWIIRKCNSRVFVGLAITVYEPFLVFRDCLIDQFWWFCGVLNLISSRMEGPRSLKCPWEVCIFPKACHINNTPYSKMVTIFVFFCLPAN